MMSNSDTLVLDSVTHIKAVSNERTIQYIGVPVDSLLKGKKEAVPDTLPKYKFLFYKSENHLNLTRYHSMREFATGMEGKPLTQDFFSGDFITSLIVLCSLVSMFVLSRAPKYMYHRMHDFLFVHTALRKFIPRTAGYDKSINYFIIQTSIFCGIIFFSCFSHFDKELRHISPYILLTVYIVSCFLFFCVKFAIYSFLGWIFLERKIIALSIESYFTLICSVGFLLYPLIVLFSDIRAQDIFVICLILFVCIKLLMFYKWIKLFSQKFFHLFLLILYFCAIEIMPCFLFYQSMVQINDILVIKF